MKNEYLVYISYISIITDAVSNISIDGYFINFTFSGKQAGEGEGRPRTIRIFTKVEGEI